MRGATEIEPRILVTHSPAYAGQHPGWVRARHAQECIRRTAARRYAVASQEPHPLSDCAAGPHLQE